MWSCGVAQPPCSAASAFPVYHVTSLSRLPHIKADVQPSLKWKPLAGMDTFQSHPLHNLVSGIWAFECDEMNKSFISVSLPYHLRNHCVNFDQIWYCEVYNKLSSDNFILIRIFPIYYPVFPENKLYLFSKETSSQGNTIELHLSGTFRPAGHPDMQKIRIIGFFFETKLPW